MQFKNRLLTMLKKKEELKIGCPIKGKIVNLNKVKDPAFSSGVLGFGVAIQPTDGKVISPVNGIIEALLPTKHVIQIRGKSGVKIFIHIGIDTINLDGKYFKAYVQEGHKVKKGTTLIEFDLDNIAAEGYSMLTPVLISNSEDYSEVLPFQYGFAEVLDDMILIKK